MSLLPLAARCGLLMRQLISIRLTKRFAARFSVTLESTPVYASEKSFLSLSRLFCVQPLHYGPLILRLLMKSFHIAHVETFHAGHLRLCSARSDC